MKHNVKIQKGFTLIELIITISILAVLVAILVVAINPAEQLARSRDSKRVADLDALRSAMNLYLATATTTVVLDGGTNTLCRNGSGTDTIWYNSSAAATTTWSVNNTWLAKSVSTTQSIGAAGWLPARFDLTPGGSPIGNLPLDPSGTADATYYYAYACNVTNKTFALGATLESTYFSSDLALESRDGGSTSTHYEVGSDPTIF